MRNEKTIKANRRAQRKTKYNTDFMFLDVRYLKED